MDSISLRTFLAAANMGSFAAAAQRVHASPSSVTERIKQLEHSLGARLFDRDKRGCRLTPAGRKFLGPASQALRAIEVARHEVRLPEHFSRSVSFGGQYVFWERHLIQWLSDLRLAQEDLAVRVTAGASARLNRDLAEGFLDMIAVYDPVFRKDVAVEPLFDDRLVLVTAGEPANWRNDYVRIEWGTSMAEIMSRLDIGAETGLVLDLGVRSAHWLTTHGMAGFMPQSSIPAELESGSLTLVEGVPTFDFSAYACWRRDLDPDLADLMVKSLKGFFA